MASFEDYDEFGNYIGADLDSDDEDVVQEQYRQESAPPQTLEGYDDATMKESDDMALMEIDGNACLCDELHESF